MKGCFFAVCLAIVSPLLCDTLRAEAVQILGYVGERVTLPCAYAVAGKRPGRPVVVSWQRGNTVVHAQQRDGPINGSQDPFFRNRTALSRGEFERGRFSLSLGPLSPRDEGRYNCIVLHGQEEDVQQTDVQLVVAANYTPPVIEEGAVRPDGLLLSCVTRGGFPEPRVEWTDGRGLPVPPATGEEGEGRTRDPHTGLWSVNSSRRVPLPSAHANYTCTVTNTRSGQTERDTWRASPRSPDSPRVQKKSFVFIVVPFIVITLLVFLWLLYLKLKRRQQPTDIQPTSCEVVPMVSITNDKPPLEQSPESGLPSQLPKES